MKRVLSGILKGKAQASHFCNKSHRVGSKILTTYVEKGDSMSSTNNTLRDEHRKSLLRDKSSTGQLRQLEPTHYEGISLREAPHSLRKRLHPNGLMLGAPCLWLPTKSKGGEIELDRVSVLLRRKKDRELGGSDGIVKDGR
uniref:Uncharacterized protein n=1 Tax=Cannabis sativa TaxID=3483 RepID=A0A803QP21_CANSA